MSTIWTHDKELSFLEIYQCYPIIWDPKHREHKDRNKVHDAWNEISEKLNITVKELKSKKDSLMTTYRMHKRKIKLSEQSGAGSDDIYTPIWFAFSLMNSFLGDLIDSNSNKTRNTITMRRSDRANSLPSSQYRRQSLESSRSKKSAFEQRLQSSSSRSRETSLEDELSLDLSQVSDFEDSSLKYGRRVPLKTSTPKTLEGKSEKRRSSLSPRLCQSRRQSRESSRLQDSLDTTYKDSLYQTSSNAGTFHTLAGRSSDADNWSVSPEYSTQSSAEASPRRGSVLYGGGLCSALDTGTRFITPSDSCCTGWNESERLPLRKPEGGEWNHFWANYNNSVSRVPMKTYYDQCPTPYRSERCDLSDAERDDAKSPNLDRINRIIQKDGLYLTPRETQSIIKCAHILGSVLSKAIDRKAKEEDRVTEEFENRGKIATEEDTFAERFEKDAYAEDDEKERHITTNDVPKLDRNIYTVTANKHHDNEPTEHTEKEQKEKKLKYVDSTSKQIVEESEEHIEKEQIQKNLYEDSANKRIEEELIELIGKEKKRKNLKLELREQNQPLELKRCDAKMTQTDISLPNTRSAPRIFEKILRQLSKSSLDVHPKEDDLEKVEEVTKDSKE